MNSGFCAAPPPHPHVEEDGRQHMEALGAGRGQAAHTGSRYRRAGGRTTRRVPWRGETRDAVNPQRQRRRVGAAGPAAGCCAARRGATPLWDMPDEGVRGWAARSSAAGRGRGKDGWSPSPSPCVRSPSSAGQATAERQSHIHMAAVPHVAGVRRQLGPDRMLAFPLPVFTAATTTSKIPGLLATVARTVAITVSNATPERMVHVKSFAIATCPVQSTGSEMTSPNSVKNDGFPERIQIRSSKSGTEQTMNCQHK
jgi:hypothetical protein